MTKARAELDPQDALDRAQDCIYDAVEVSTPKRRIALARKALSISPLCADAHVILAGHSAKGSDEELDHWRRGVEAGEKALGKSGFKDYAGHFWGFLETRPYMRARNGLALALWARGARDEAVDHLLAMLALNPNDNQGLRYALAGYLVELRRTSDFDALMKSFPEDGSAFFAWPRALSAFQIGGDCAASRAQLKKAMASNAHVRDFLSDRRKLPKRRPAYYSPGDASEAMFYVTDNGGCWSATPGALDWLRASVEERVAKPKKKVG